MVLKKIVTLFLGLTLLCSCSPKTNEVEESLTISTLEDLSSLEIGDRFQINCNSIVSNLSWVITNPEVASITKYGTLDVTVTIFGEGDCSIFAKTLDGSTISNSIDFTIESYYQIVLDGEGLEFQDGINNFTYTFDLDNKTYRIVCQNVEYDFNSHTISFGENTCSYFGGDPNDSYIAVNVDLADYQDRIDDIEIALDDRVSSSGNHFNIHSYVDGGELYLYDLNAGAYYGTYNLDFGPTELTKSIKLNPNGVETVKICAGEKGVGLKIKTIKIHVRN